MGFFDFIHGGRPMKSEAEAYMEKRNKEYAKKAAEYKRKEQLETAKERLSSIQTANTKTVNMSSTIRHLGTTVQRAVKEMCEDMHETEKKAVGTSWKQVIIDDLRKSISQIDCDECEHDD